MKFSTHGNGNGLDDLYILPESSIEFEKLVGWAKQNNIRLLGFMGNVKGSDWYGKAGFEIPFGESFQEKIEESIK